MMKKLVFFLGCLLIFCLGLEAQVKTVYYVGDEVITDSTLVRYATSYAVYGKLTNDSLYAYKRYDIYDSLMSTGFFKDEALKVPHGKFVHYLTVPAFNELYNLSFYDEDYTSFVYEKGEYVDGLSVGRWSSYYPNGKVMATVVFEAGLQQGEFVSYDAKGQVETFGKYVNGKKEGEWLFRRGKKKVFYVNNVIQKKASAKIN
jgi:hypothetical protein